ncbi:radial spoke head 10 homolog B-like [Cylas formicarius]|uniref:radial spoke head 10 homolog B-like n=1 Tax=Cylas formicarius TaxID=197179 RepID=UPI002958DB33|nr:radial spoke head 10 homolog B-like [Cylas formicarius]
MSNSVSTRRKSVRSNRSSKSSRVSSVVAPPPQETVPDPTPVDLTKKLTTEFFESLLGTIIVGTTPLTGDKQNVDPNQDVDGDFKIIFKNGNVYEGQVEHNLMHGKGKFRWADGTIYEGSFAEGYPDGQGKIVLPDLSTYEGQVSKSFFHGHGVFNIVSTPILYSGQWRQGRKCGEGWLLYAENNWYQGEWREDQKHGLGFRHYPHGAAYHGNWCSGKPHGRGWMVWENNDHYTGEWREGLQNGYGEYTWGVLNGDAFFFTNNNSYEGNWTTGKRNGEGVMNFGHECGAKLKGTWRNNDKHGPGLMIGGNGLTSERNPLFENDAPLLLPQLSTTRLPDHDSSEDAKNVPEGTHQNDHLQPVPFFSDVEDIDLDYWIEMVLRPCKFLKVSEISTIQIKNVARGGSVCSADSMSKVNYVPSVNVHVCPDCPEPSVSKENLPDINHEARQLKNLLINHLTQLRTVYRVYARGGNVLVRMFLWQLLWDIDLTEKEGVPLVTFDEIAAGHPKACFETTHCPWEPIYFWQFLHALLGACCLSFLNGNKCEFTPTSGIMYYLFKDFMQRLMSNVGRFRGHCLNALKDLVPISAVYSLYRSVGEPHRVADFLKHCDLSGERVAVPCYETIDLDNQHKTVVVLTGKNVVNLNNELQYKVSCQRRIEGSSDAGLGMSVFKCLGRKRVLQCLSNVCPQIVKDNGKFSLSYRLSFIEFYEAFLLLAREKVGVGEEAHHAPIVNRESSKRRIRPPKNK